MALLAPCLRAAEVIPPAPARYFNDYAGVVSPAAADELNSELEQFERDTSNQIVVAIYPHMQSDSSIEDYAVRVAQSWRAGQKGRDNGAVLFVFVQDRSMYIATGYGLEGALPDALCKRIIDDEIVPGFRRGDFDGGLAAGVRALMAAARGEYRGTGSTDDERRVQGSSNLLVPALLILVLIVFSYVRSRQQVVYRRGGRTSVWGGGGPWIFPGGFGGGGFGGGGLGGGGGFSGGGGGFGGGGAGGSW